MAGKQTKLALAIIGSMVLSMNGSAKMMEISARDSLKKIIYSNTSPDTIRIRSLNALALDYQYTNPDSMMHYARIMKDESEKIDYKPGMIRYYWIEGNRMNDLGKINQALSWNLKALELAQASGEKQLICMAYGYVGNDYQSLNLERALINYYNSLKLATELKLNNFIVICLGNIASVYNKAGNIKKSIEVNKRLIGVLDSMGNQKGKAGVYHNLAIALSASGQTDEAVRYYLKAYELNKQLNNRLYLKNNLEALITEFGYDPTNRYAKMTGDKRSSFEMAVSFFLELKKMTLEDHDTSRLTVGFYRIGNVYLEQKDFSKALFYFGKAWNWRVHFLNPDLRASLVYDIADVYSKSGNFKKATEFYETYISIKDSLDQVTIAETVNRLNESHEIEIRDEQVKLLKLHNEQQVILIILAFAGVFALAVTVFLIILNRRRLKKAYLLVNDQKEEIECQKEEVECQKEELENTLDKLKQTQSQLIQSEKMASLGMLTAGIAHEINNPINFINSGAISLQKDYEDLQKIIQSIGQLPPETQKLADKLGLDELLKNIPQTIEDIKTGVSRTSEIVKGLRNFTRMDVSELKEADLHEGIDSTLLLLSHKIKDRIRIVKDYDEHIGSIKCYAGPLNQVFMNLLNNAIDAIDQKTKEDSAGGVPSDEPISDDHYQISITTKLMEEGEKKQVKIVISDNGVGVREEIRDKIFDPFFTTKDVGKGTGLGLSICHGIIEKHGGSISFESKVNEGTAFTILLLGNIY